MKKVFRIWKMLERDLEFKRFAIQNVANTIECLKCSWPFLLEGKTLEECHELGYMPCEDWFIEEE